MESIVGQRVNFVDVKNEKINEGIVLTETIGSGGYRIYIIIDDKNIKHNVEVARICKSNDNELLEKFVKLKNLMNKYDDEFEKLQKERRESLIGKPEFKEISERFE